MPNASEYEAARRARSAMRDVTEAYRKLRKLRGAVTGAERELMDAMRDAIREANAALGLDVALTAPPARPAADPDEAREAVREAVWA